MGEHHDGRKMQNIKLGFLNLERRMRVPREGIYCYCRICTLDAPTGGKQAAQPLELGCHDALKCCRPSETPSRSNNHDVITALVT